MSITFDTIRTTDARSKPALGDLGDCLGQRLYTSTFSEMKDHWDEGGKQIARMERRAQRQAGNLPEGVIEFTYDFESDRNDFKFLEGKAVLFVPCEKIEPGAPVYRASQLWYADSDLGYPHLPHVGYVMEVRRGQGACIEFTTEDPVKLIAEDEWGTLGHTLTYENKYTRERRYRFRYSNGELHMTSERSRVEMGRAAEQSYADGLYTAYPAVSSNTFEQVSL